MKESSLTLLGIYGIKYIGDMEKLDIKVIFFRVFLEVKKMVWFIVGLGLGEVIGVIIMCLLEVSSKE